MGVDGIDAFVSQELAGQFRDSAFLPGKQTELRAAMLQKGLVYWL